MKEGSVAPKERVNITYKPAIGNAKEEVELPLKMLIAQAKSGPTPRSRRRCATTCRAHRSTATPSPPTRRRSATTDISSCRR